MCKMQGAMTSIIPTQAPVFQLLYSWLWGPLYTGSNPHGHTVWGQTSAPPGDSTMCSIYVHALGSILCICMTRVEAQQIFNVLYMPTVHSIVESSPLELCIYEEMSSNSIMHGSTVKWKIRKQKQNLGYTKQWHGKIPCHICHWKRLLICSCAFLSRISPADNVMCSC